MKPVIVSVQQEPKFYPIESAEDMRKLKEVKEFLNKHNVYIASSIEEKGTHIGRFKDIMLDADGYPVIICDIDKESCTV